jgi:erythromycin esterase-like protein
VGQWYQVFDQTTDAEVIDLLRRASIHLTPTPVISGGTERDRVRAGALVLDDATAYDALLHVIGSARIVLLGDASHGTHVFYRERAFLTERLIAEHGFAAVAVEADWPDAYRVNRYVRGASEDDHATDALADFGRFPTWMWRNTDVVAFVEWLRAHNDTQPVERRTGFYGMDLYSLHTSMQAVLAYLSTVDPDAARIARARYACFDQFGKNRSRTGMPASWDGPRRASSRSSRNWSTCSVGARSTHHGMDASRAMSSSMRNRTRG